MSQSECAKAVAFFYNKKPLPSNHCSFIAAAIAFMRDAANISRNRVRLDRSSLHTIRHRESRTNTVGPKSLREQVISSWKLLSYVATAVAGHPTGFAMDET